MLEKRLIELLTRKMAGELSSIELLELNDILSSYPEALQEEQIFKKIWDSKAEEEDIALFYERHRNSYKDELVFAEEKNSITVSKNRLIRYRLFAVACILAIIISVGLVGYKNSFSKDSFKQIIAGKGVRKLLTLPDGTKVWLNADSRLSYDPEMKEAKQRLVTLTGEAFFDVAHDKQHPFIINANKVTVRVLGTAFNIKAYPGDAKCETTLIRGSVELTINDGSRQKFILKPSEKIALIDEKDDNYTKENNHLRKGKTLLIENITPVTAEDGEYIPETSWTENRLVFENETLEEIALKLERWYNVKIRIENAEATNYHFTGPFTNETIEQVLTAMQLIKPFKFKINNNDITIH